MINRSAIKNFYDNDQYPLYFLDCETSSSAIPVLKSVKPHAHIPFQFSIHVMAAGNIADLQHFEYLADKAELPIKMIVSMQEIIELNGSIVPSTNHLKTIETKKWPPYILTELNS